MQVSSFPATCRVRGRGFGSYTKTTGRTRAVVTVVVVMVVMVATGAVERPAMAGAIRLAWAASITMAHRKHRAPCRCQVLRCKKPMQRSSANVPTFGCN